MVLQEAIETYHELLTDELAGESQAQIDDQLQRRRVFYGARPLPTTLRPRLLTPEQYRFVQDRTRLVLGAFRSAYRAAMENEAILDQFGLFDWERHLIRVDPGYRASSPISRFDAFFDPSRNDLKFTEYNGESPALGAYNDALGEIFLGLPIMREYLRRYDVRPLPLRHDIMHMLVDSYRQFVGRPEAPRIAIVDFPNVGSYSEFVMLRDYFTSQGLACVIADLNELEYRNGKVWANDFHVTLIYKRVLISELIAWGGSDGPIVQAIRDRAVCMVDPFRAKLLSKKASLAVVGDERNAALFTPEEQQAIAAHIPWTRVVAERTTLYHDRMIDLVPFVVEHKDQMILKPNDGYGGKGIILGQECDGPAWEQAVRAALGEPWVVQERLPVPEEPFPRLVDGHLALLDLKVDTDPFVFYGDYVDGCLSRLSTAALLNVAGGGAMAPTFVVSRR